MRRRRPHMVNSKGTLTNGVLCCDRHPIAIGRSSSIAGSSRSGRRRTVQGVGQ